MANSIITTAGLALFAQALQDGTTVPVDRMIFADIPELDTDADPDPDQSIPETHIVFNAEIQTRGKIDDRTVVYSRILSASDGDFHLNWIGLYSSSYETLIAVCQVPRHWKYKTSGFQAGNTLYKNFALQFANAAQLTGISIAPETWQYDFDNRYAAISHQHEIGQVNGLQTALNEKAASTDLTAHNASAEAHPGTFVKCSGDSTVTGNLTLSGDGKGNLTASGTVSAGYIKADGNIKGANLEASENASAYTLIANRIFVDVPADAEACGIFGRDVNGGSIGCFWTTRDSEKSETRMSVYDSDGINVGSIAVLQRADGVVSTWLNVCNGYDTEIARCDWVKNQIAGGAPGHPNFSAAVDLTAAYVSGWTADRTGWLFVTQDDTNQALWINGNMVSRYYEEKNKPEYFGPIRAGDFVASATVGSADSYDSSKISTSVRKMIFYPNA